VIPLDQSVERTLDFFLREHVAATSPAPLAVVRDAVRGGVFAQAGGPAP